MRRALVVVALLAACRDEQRPAVGPPSGSAVSVSGVSGDARSSVVPTLPRSEDGDAALRALDAEIARAALDERAITGLLLDRAAITGQLEDYQRALAVADAAARKQPDSHAALGTLARAQLAVHAFADARVTIDRITKLAPSAADELRTSLDHATGNLDAALAARKARVDVFADARAVTLYAATLADADRLAEAIALIPTAAATLRSNTPEYLAWLLFQWGRLHEQHGELAAARALFAEAHRRLPGHVEATVHLAETLTATGSHDAALALVAPVATRHPALLALHAKLTGRADLRASAAHAWERYVVALPAAFADHAARFYLDVGRNPVRAAELADINLAARDTPASRALAIEAALAADNPAQACAVVGSLVTQGPRRARFQAWRAVSACGRTDDAARLARELGI